MGSGPETDNHWAVRREPQSKGAAWGPEEGRSPPRDAEMGDNTRLEGRRLRREVGHDGACSEDA